MNYFWDFLQNIDVFARPVGFTILKKEALKTPLGGVLSIACLIIGIALTRFIGVDFFYNQNLCQKYLMKIQVFLPVFQLPQALKPFALQQSLGNFS